MASAARAFWSTSRMVVPSAFSAATCAKISATRRGARPMLGSSSSSSRGSAMSARPMASICCWPPESMPASSRRLGTSAGNIANTRSAPSRAPRANAPRRRLSSTLSAANTWRPSGTCTMPACTRWRADLPARSMPSKRIVPPQVGWTPEIARSNVDLPAPFAPTSATSSPRPTPRSMPDSAGMRP
jgi:hypothetical protein